MNKLPINIGLAGIAIAERSPQVFMDGEDEQEFCLEVDNTVQVMDYENVLVCPMFDSKNRLKGVIHLINKIDDSPIDENDKQEILTVCPAISEILNMAEAAREVTSLSAGLTTAINTIGKNVENQSK